METNFNPNYAIHPGVFLREEMAAMKISQKALSEKIGVCKTVINEILHEKRKINADLAVKLELVLYSPASYWLNLQAIFDEAEARIRLNIPVKEETVESARTNSMSVKFVTRKYCDYYQIEKRCIA